MTFAEFEDTLMKNAWKAHEVGLPVHEIYIATIRAVIGLGVTVQGLPLKAIIEHLIAAAEKLLPPEDRN